MTDLWLIRSQRFFFSLPQVRFWAKRESTGNPSKMTPSRHRAHHNEIIEA